MQFSEEIIDILKALQKVSMTLEILKETKVGVTVNKCKKKYVANNTVGDMCKALIGEWKKVAEQTSNTAISTTTTSVSVSSSIALKSLEPPSTSEITASSSSTEQKKLRVSDGAESPRNGGMDEVDYDNHYENLHKSRKQVVDIFAQNLLSATGNNASIARFLSMSIESSLHAAFPWDDNGGDSKPYMTKFRSLSYNLKRNEVSKMVVGCIVI